MSTLHEAAQEFIADYENGDLGDLKHYARALRAALAQGCYIAQDMTRQEYERLYPDAEEEVK